MGSYPTFRSQWNSRGWKTLTDVATPVLQEEREVILLPAGACAARLFFVRIIRLQVESMKKAVDDGRQ